MSTNSTDFGCLARRLTCFDTGCPDCISCGAGRARLARPHPQPVSISGEFLCPGQSKQLYDLCVQPRRVEDHRISARYVLSLSALAMPAPQRPSESEGQQELCNRIRVDG